MDMATPTVPTDPPEKLEAASAYALLEALKRLAATPEPPRLGPQPRPNTESLATLNQRLRPQVDSLPAETQAAVRSAVLLWHDHLDASHTLSQSLASPDGSFLHGIMHRREPDYGNAKYWFRRVGRHAAFPELARRVSALLKQEGEGALGQQLLPKGQWDAFAFVDACEDAADRAETDARVQLLRAIQAVEFDVLLAHICGATRSSE
jgi:hypothetical protein